MEIVTRATRLHSVAAKLAAEGKTIGLVPTMGALHEGHFNMVREARKLTDAVIVAIFVNPLQFSSQAELEAYPHDLARDADLLLPLGVDYVFVPNAEEMYPPGFATWVEVKVHDQELESAARPDHFRGAATVLTIYFNLIQPKFVFMGQKDAQQTIVAKKMVRDLHMPTEIIVMPIIREADGVAMSTRNVLLTPAERQAAVVMPRALQVAERLFNEGERQAARLIKAMRREIEQEPLAKLDYIVATDTEHLDSLDDLSGRATLISLAVSFSRTRLIDNVILHDEKFKPKAGIKLG
jgi:pantoate--beta-alanine ligase